MNGQCTKTKYILLTKKAIKNYEEGKLIKKEDTWELSIAKTTVFNCWDKKVINN